MSGIHRTKIDWADSVWNPVSGCLHGCDYCYAAVLVRRFQPKASEWPDGTVEVATHDSRCFIESRPTALRDADGKYIRSTPYPRGFAPTLHTYKLQHLRNAVTPRRIFVGSMTDLFGDWVPDEWLEAIFLECLNAPQHAYMFLTKNPDRYAQLAASRLLPEGDNFWWGSTVPTADIPYWVSEKHKTFISIEPLLGEFQTITNSGHAPDWVIVGAMTGSKASKHRPKESWVQAIADECAMLQIPLFMKSSLADTCGKQLQQEHPAAMTAHVQKTAPVDWKSKTAHKVFVENVRDEKTCRQCGIHLQGQRAWRFSARYYICEKCYENEGAENDMAERE